MFLCNQTAHVRNRNLPKAPCPECRGGIDASRRRNVPFFRTVRQKRTVYAGGMNASPTAKKERVRRSANTILLLLRGFEGYCQRLPNVIPYAQAARIWNGTIPTVPSRRRRTYRPGASLAFAGKELRQGVRSRNTEPAAEHPADSWGLSVGTVCCNRSLFGSVFL